MTPGFLRYEYEFLWQVEGKETLRPNNLASNLRFHQHLPVNVPMKPLPKSVVDGYFLLKMEDVSIAMLVYEKFAGILNLIHHIMATLRENPAKS